jgi:beta-catenin-like protein 1
MAANEEEATDEDELEWYSRRLDAGLSSLQNADYVLAWVCMEEDGVSRVPSQWDHELTVQARAHAHKMLKRKDQSFANVVKVLEGKYLQYWLSKADSTEFRDNIEDDEDEEGEVQVPLQKMILEQLIAFLAALE